MWGLFVGAAAAVLAPVGPGALVPLKMAIASADSIGSDVYVAVVVDFGNGSGMTTVSKCVPVASNARDSDALAAAVGSSNVAYAASGLLCAIDNYPANGVQNCGQSVGNGNYDYWSYWHGSSGSWVYANNGPTEQSVSSPANDVVGLRFQLDQPDNSSNAPPSVTPSYAQICNASTEVPPPPAAAVATTTTTTAPAATPGVAATPTTSKTGAGSGPAVPTTTAVGARSKATGATTTTVSAPGQTSTTETATGSNVAGGGSHGSSDLQKARVASAAARESSGGGSSSDLLPVIVVAVIVAALGVFAFLRWRRRPAEE
jgi:hypothetical protein